MSSDCGDIHDFLLARVKFFFTFFSRVLTNLVLRGNNIGNEGAAALASALRVNGVLTNLDVRLNAIAGEAAQQLATAVLVSPSLERCGAVPLKELRENTRSA